MQIIAEERNRGAYEEYLDRWDYGCGYWRCIGNAGSVYGAIAGGLAALHYGYNCIPEGWKNIIIKREEIITLCELVESEQHK